MHISVCVSGWGGFGFERGGKRILSKTALYKTGIFEVGRLIRA